MKFLIILVILFSVALVIQQNGEKLVLSDSKTIFSGQKVQLDNGLFSPLYLHVFEYQDLGLLKHVNLTEEQKGDVMRIESFKLLQEDGLPVWLAMLKKDGDDKTYLCEIKEALNTKEIQLLK